jgi:DNA-binding MarR family transcriptional regulator
MQDACPRFAGVVSMLEFEIVLFLRSQRDVKNLSRFLGINSENVPVYMQRLRKKGFVTRNKRTHRTKVAYFLTDNGQKLIEAMRENISKEI